MSLFIFLFFIKIYFVTGLIDESEKIRQVVDYPFGSILKGDKVLTSNHIAVFEVGNTCLLSGVDYNV